MAVDMFIKIDGIKGESKDSKHPDEIDVIAWSWGATNSGSSHIGGGSGSGKVNVHDLSITKYVDKASADLFKACAQGKHIANALLTVRKAGGTDPLEYLKVTMNDFIISSVSTGGSHGEERLTENVTINFSKIKYEYKEQKADGSPGSNFPVTIGVLDNTVS
jgi:type VI secretion system secreted protein Hcp